MRPVIAGVVGLVVGVGGAAAQFPVQPYAGPPAGPFAGGFNPGAFMPNIFNPQTQPLSPYLNLLRGGNLAANYYYGVRPGTVGLTPRGVGGAPFVAPGGNRPLFFPQLAVAGEPTGDGEPGVLPPAGHPVVFGNTLGYFPVPGGQAGGARPGLAGIGSRPAPRR